LPALRTAVAGQQARLNALRLQIAQLQERADELGSPRSGGTASTKPAGTAAPRPTPAAPAPDPAPTAAPAPAPAPTPHTTTGASGAAP